MTYDPSTRLRKRWLILAPADLQATWSIPDDAWEVLEGQTYLRLFPSFDAVPTPNFIGGEPDYLFLGGGVSDRSSAKQFKASITITDGREAIFSALENLVLRSRAAGNQAAIPLTLLDFAFPENADKLAARQTGTEAYTLRYGKVKNLKQAGAMVGTASGEQYIKGGFTFDFEEAKLRVGV